MFFSPSGPQDLWEHPEREPAAVQRALEETSRLPWILFHYLTFKWFENKEEFMSVILTTILLLSFDYLK